MKTLLILIFLSASVADAQNVMRVKMKDGSLQVFPISSITKITFSGVTGVDERTNNQISTVLKTFALLQNYPNPFNPTTTIQYAIPQPDVVTVRIFDVTGKIVRDLVNGHMEAGEHRLTWDSRNNSGQMVSSGTYIYDIRYKGSVLTRKMIVLK